MNIDHPKPSQLADLRELWQEAFGDDDAFLDIFFTYGFHPQRCLCLTENGKPAAALYWFDCHTGKQPLAYLYGVATAKACRGKGLCRRLMEYAHNHLQQLGYGGILLVPGEAGLWQMYEKLGYQACTSVTEFSAEAAAVPAVLKKLDREAYCRLRRAYLPENGVVQEGACLHFLEKLAYFYAGGDFLAAVSQDAPFFVMELLGDPQAAPGILAALGQKEGRVRIPGAGQPFAMYRPLSDAPAPAYFGLALD